MLFRSNGACYDSYLSAPYFTEQLPSLNPDLVIISLGTNDAFDKSITAENFIQNIDAFIAGIKAQVPEATIMFTTIGDSYIAKRGKKHRTYYIDNPRIEILNTALKKYSKENGFAYWDLFNVMGGKNSMAKWYKNKLADNKRIHLSRDGYFITGELFSNALLNAFMKYKTTHGLISE